MGEFKKLVLKKFPAASRPESSEEHYWKKFQSPITIREYGAVRCIDFSPTKPHDVAVTTGSKIQVFGSSDGQLRKTFSRFKNAAYSGRFRSDGQLLVAGDGDGTVKVFEYSGRLILRDFKGHTKAAQVSHFALDNKSVYSASDDGTVRLWDLAGEEAISVFKGHQDYVRAGTVCKSSNDLFLTGSYDHTVHLWDRRSGSCVVQVDHGAPVDAVLMFPSGTACISAGGNVIKVWDVVQGGRRIAAASNHQKAITCLAFDTSAGRLLSGSVDRQVKVHDVSSYKVVASLSYPSSILSLGLSPLEDCLAVGMTGGYLSLKKRKTGAGNDEEEQREAIAGFSSSYSGSFRYFARGKKEEPGEGDQVVEKIKRKSLREYERFLKKFRYRDALDASLRTGRADVVTSLLREMMLRDGLEIALGGRDEESLEPILLFLIRYLVNPLYSQILCDVFSVLLDMYSDVVGVSERIDSLFAKLKQKIGIELRFHSDIFQLLGTMEMIFAANPAIS
ncbi:U3 small nucleolar RNA-associated protein 15 homolog [Oscarella lobularis]|uniref:U3 small nucleolar RNA-associated protein 15 homolog n=1 Tax=Oscarella lobularis TaxID=121494 RepID=UPI0033138EE1